MYGDGKMLPPPFWRDRDLQLMGVSLTISAEMRSPSALQVYLVPSVYPPK